MRDTSTTDGELKTYRGSSLEEILPRIRAELGPDALIVRQREGLVGGVGGFFQRRCVEVDARPRGPRVDVYDDGSPVGAADEEGAEAAGEAEAKAGAPEPRSAPRFVRNDAATREGLAEPAIRELVEQAQPFAELLGGLTAPATNGAGENGTAAAKLDADAPVEAEIAAEGDDPREPQPAVAAPRRAKRLREGLVTAGLGEDIATAMVDAVVASHLPFATPARLRTLVRDELALRIPVAPAPAPGRRALAVVGPAGAGKTAAVAAIAAAHAAAGARVRCVALQPRDGGAALEALLGDSSAHLLVAADAAAAAAELGGEDGLILVDTPPSWPGAPGLERLAASLAALDLDEIHLALRAGTAATVGAELIAGLAALRPSRLLATGLGETAYLGSIADVAIRAELPLSYMAEGPREIAPADARELAAKLTP